MAESVNNHTFSDVASGIKFVEDFAKKNFHPIKHASRTTVAQYNKKIITVDRHITVTERCCILGTLDM